MNYTFLFSILLLAACKQTPIVTPPVVPPVVVPPPADNRVFYTPEKFVMGGDLSYVNQIEDNGGVYQDSQKVKDPYRLFKDRGLNCVRVRLWHTPTWTGTVNSQGKLYSDLQDVARTIRRAKAAGMTVSLNLHYSDTWADPATQKMPLAWEKLSATTLKDSVYQYTLTILKYLEARNLTPEMIQVGNENNPGMLFPHGQVKNNNWQPFADLLKSGIKAVRDFSATSSIKPQIILHVAQLQNASWWAEGVVVKGGVTDFDILGVSHYYKWGTINSMAAIGETIKTLKTKYNKKVMIVETAYSWTNKGGDNYTNIMSSDTPIDGFEISPEGQYQYFKAFTQQIISAGGSGIMYWEPAWISSPMKDLWGTGSSWENNALFDFSGNALPAMNFMTEKYSF